MLIGRVAVIGYPNVGKSTLVNRLSGTREAIVHDTPGVTRDRKEVECEWNGHRFLLVDTGGIDMADRHDIARQVVQQANSAMKDCDLILLVGDAAEGVSAADLELAKVIRKEGAEVLVVANKLDNSKNDLLALDFHQLGLGDPIPVSGQHGTGTGDLLDLIVARLLEIGHSFEPPVDNRIRIAVLGRPNVGKSTLVNSILGADRVIVSDERGTTRDSIDTSLDWEGREIVLVDTAGIKKKGGHRDPLEYYSEVRSRQAAGRANVALVLVDSSDGLREADITIADMARQEQCATLILLSKWDKSTVDLEDIRITISEKLRQRPSIITSSGLTGRNTAKIMQAAIDLYDRSSRRISTSELNRFLGELKESLPAPTSRRGKRSRKLNLLFGAQYQVSPPRFRFIVNDRALVTRNWAWAVENRMRKEFGFEGCPLMIDFQNRS